MKYDSTFFLDGTLFSINIISEIIDNIDHNVYFYENDMFSILQNEMIDIIDIIATNINVNN